MDKHSAHREDPEGSDDTRRVRARPKIIDHTPRDPQYAYDREFTTPAGEPAMIVMEVLAGLRPEVMRVRSLYLRMTEDTPISSTAEVRFCKNSTYIYVRSGVIAIVGDTMVQFDLADPDSVQKAADSVSDEVESVLKKQKAVVERSGRWISELEKHGC